MSKEELYLESLHTWIDASGIFKSSGKGERNVVVIAMSRKMPRLLSWITNFFNNPLADNVTVITEHAIPFYMQTLTDERIVVIDDAMYYGTTLENVTENIAWCTGRKDIEVFPIIKKKNTRSFQYAELNDCKEIEENDIPFYTTRNARNILSLGIPMDMEYPIVSFIKERKRHISIEDIEFFLKECFPNKDIYAVKHQIYDSLHNHYITQTSFTILLDSNQKKRNPDFSKLRLYISEDSLQVVAYSPFIIPAEQLEHHSDQIEFGSNFNEIWQRLLNTAQPIVKSNLEIDSHVQTDTMSEEYKRRRLRSLAVSANYLESFCTLLQYKNELYQFLEKFGYILEPHFDTQDLIYLFGPELCEDIKENLIYAWQNEKQTDYICSFDNQFLTQHIVNLIPPAFELSYAEKNRIAWNNVKNVSAALSVMFSNLHFNIGLASIDNTSFDKLCFGESFGSINFELAPLMKSDNLLKDIHIWIDQEIDKGCVAPKYELIDIDGIYCWKRLFRAGENENSLIKIARLVFYTMDRMEKTLNTKYVSEKQMEEILSILLTDPYRKINYDYRLAQFDVRWEEGAWHLFISDNTSEKNQRLISILKGLSFLRSETVGTQKNLSKQDNELNSILATTTPLSDEQTVWVNAYIDLYLSFTKVHFPAIANHFLLKEEHINNQFLSSWLKKITDFITNWDVTDFNEEQKQLLDDYTVEIQSIYFLRMILTKEQILSLPIENPTEECRTLQQIIFDNNILELNRKSLHRFLVILFYWESFIAIFKEENIAYAQHSLSILEKSLNIEVPEEIKEKIKTDFQKKDTQSRKIVKFRFQQVFNSNLQ